MTNCESLDLEVSFLSLVKSLIEIQRMICTQRVMWLTSFPFRNCESVLKWVAIKLKHIDT